MIQSKKHLIPLLLRIVGPFLSVYATKLLLQTVQTHLQIQVIELIYLLPVMLSTVLWGLTPGIMAGVTAFLVFNYFHIQPYNTFFVHQNQDVITLIIFLFVAVVLSQFIGKAREGMRLARIREWEATRMYELISALSSMKDVQSIARNLVIYTKNTFLVDRIELIIDRKGEDVLVISLPEDSRPDDHPTITCTLDTARGIEGEMHIWHDRQQFLPHEERLLKAFASQGALSLERIRLAKGENMVRILEESDQLKTSLLNSVSHELRTPLSVIKAAVSSLRSGTVNWDTEARQDLLVTIEEETDELNLLVGNLLDMSRIEAGALNPQRKWNAIGEIALGVINKMHKQLADYCVEVDFPDDLLLVPTDFVMLGQVFLNLLSNSIKYSPIGSTIAIKAYNEQDFLHVQVANQGPFVPEEHLERIFDKFHRVTEAERITGTGLGLSICKGIVEAHAGKIWAENGSDKFIFHFLLPLTMDGAFPTIPQEELNE
jgi:two-component system sensor histidine kinase KdpD